MLTVIGGNISLLPLTCNVVSRISRSVKAIFLPIVSLIFFVFIQQLSYGQIATSTWSLTSNGNPVTTGNITASAIAGGSGIGPISYNAGGANSANWTSSGTFDASDYYQFTISPSSGYILSVNSLQFFHERTRSNGSNDGGPIVGSVYYSTNGFSTSTQIGGNFTVNAGSTPFSASGLSITVPDGNTLTIRIYGWAAENSNGRYSILNLILSGTTNLAMPPSCTTPISPTDLQSDVLVDGTLTWNAEPNSSGYNLYFGTDAGATNIENGTDLGNVTTYTPTSNLDFLTDYYWKIVPYNSYGSASGCVIWNFITENISYCSAASTAFDLYEAITNLTFAGIDNSSPASKTAGYTDFTGLVTPAEVVLGQNYPISVSNEFLLEEGYGGYCKVYIDFDQNGVFDALTELVFESPYVNNTTMTGTISIPVTAVSGSTRMRIVIEGDADNTGALPCGSFTWGEVEDYTVNVNALCTDASLTLTTANSTQSICEDDAISVIEYLVGGDATGVNVSGLPGGLSSNYNAGTLTISGTPSSTGTFNFTVTTTGTPSGCSEATEIGSITISTMPALSVLSNNGPICSGEDAVFTITGTDGSTVTYDINGGSTNSVSLSGGTATVTVNGPVSNQTINLLSISNGSCLLSLAESSTVNIYSPAATLSGSEVICAGDAADLSISFSGGTPPYSFTYTDGTISTSLSGITSNPYTISVSPSVSSTYTLSSFTDANCSGATLGSGVVVIEGGILFTPGNDTTICPEGLATLKIVLNDKSVQFDGTSGRINIANSTDINTSNWANRTIGLWFKANDVTTRQFLYEEGAQVNGFSIYLEGGYIYVHAWENNLTWGELMTPVNVGTWYNIAFVYDAAASDGEYFKGYIDGVYFGGNSDPSANNGMNAHSGDINIGMNGGNTRFPDNSTDSNPNYFNGFIDEFKLWNRSLDVNELLTERWNVNDGTQSGSNLIVYYNFNNDSGTASTDETSGNDGTVSGGCNYQTETPFIPVVSWLPGGMSNLTETVSPSSTTLYTYTLTQPFNTCQTTGSINVTVDTPVTPTLSGNSPVCPGEVAVFTISGTPGDLVDYTGDATGTATIGAGGTVTVSINNVTADVSLNLVNANNGNCDLSLSGISETITVEDNTPPVPDNANLSDITAECEVTSLTAPTSTDYCEGTITGTHNATLPITTQGTTVVIWSYDDGNGNISTQTQNVIINDVTDPTFTCPTAAAVFFDASCQITIPDLLLGITDESDNCGTPTLSQSPAAGTVLVSGAGTTHTVTVTADDGNGNTTSCVVDVTGASANPIDVEVADLGSFCQSGQSGTTNISWNVNLLAGTADWSYDYTINDGSTDVASGINVSATGNITISYVMNNSSADKTYTLTLTNVKDDCGGAETGTANNADAVTVYSVPATGEIIPD